MRDVSNIRGDVFSEGVNFNIGDESSVHFWFDNWLEVGSLSNLLPRVIRMASNKESVVQDCFV